MSKKEINAKPLVAAKSYDIFQLPDSKHVFEKDSEGQTKTISKKTQTHIKSSSE